MARRVVALAPASAARYAPRVSSLAIARSVARAVPRPRNARWTAAILALAAGATRAEAALAARVTVATIAKYCADADFARELYVATQRTVENAMQRIRANATRAAEVLVAQLDADADAVGWARPCLAARDVLDRVGCAAPARDAALAFAAAAGGAAGATLATRAETIAAVRALLGDEAARAAGRRLLVDVADGVAETVAETDDPR